MSSSYTCTVSVRAGSAPADGKAKSHHHKTRNGRPVQFANPYPSAGVCAQPGFNLAFFRALFLSLIQGRLHSADNSKAKATIPSLPPTFLPTRTAGNGNLRATWLGHAAYLVEFPSGLRAVFDPVLEDRCAPTQYFGPRRYSRPACQPAQLPMVDAVFISHSHYDHLSYPTVSQMAARHPDAHFFVGLGLADWFRRSGIGKVTEMDWWDEAEVRLDKVRADTMQARRDGDPESMTARISCLPSQHASGRALDKDATLWVSWGVRSGDKSVWFAGDTGYRAITDVPGGGVDHDYDPEYAHLPRFPAFTHIRELRPPFDLGLIPIGAYMPRGLFSGLHASPYDAVEILVDVGCRRALAIHWGTWALTPEHVMEPPGKLKEALKRKGLPEEGLFDTCAIGESREF